MSRIAEWNVYGSKNDAPLVQLCVAIHAPELDPDSKHDDCRTMVELCGLSESRYIFGVNSMQSLVLAMRVLHIEIEVALNDGWIFFFGDDHSQAFDLLAAVTPIEPSTGELNSDTP
ncbi:hypothetical protein N9Y42_11085 [Mariniblastus sp.]|nr:hypothetical protein [Mariniblastus sp.]